jgi:hypothetical protein
MVFYLMTSKMMGKRITDVISNTSTWSIVTIVAVIFLVFDGIITSLPFYDLQAHQSFSIHFLFGTEVLICALCQVLYLKIIKRKYSINPTISYFKRYADITYSIVSVTQYVIIALLLVSLLEIETLSQYHTVIILISILLSLCLSVGLSSLLAFRFLMWIRFKVDYLIISYTAVAVLITINSIFVAVFMSLEMQGKPTIIDSSFFWTNTQITNYDIHQIQSYLLLASFVSLWIASFFLLRRQRTKWRALKFYTIISIPLVYYLGLPQLVVSNVLVQHNILNMLQSYTFNVVNSIMSKPIGGALFGVAFWMVARSIKDKNISDYMRLSAFGIMLLSISNVDAGLYLLPYPPFGLPTITFVGISSYMLFVGIYHSSISVSMNNELRKSIEKSVEQEIKFISKIGRSQVEHEIQSKVKGVTKRSAKILEENSGVEASLEDEDIEEYIKHVVKEREKMLERNSHVINDKRDNHKVSS